MFYEGVNSMTNVPQPSWSKADVAQLLLLAEVGISATQIANKLGKDKTRNAVLGKLHGLGIIKKSHVPVRYNAEAVKPNYYKPRPKAKPPTLGAIKVQSKKPIKPILDFNSGPKIGVLQLTSQHCRWPIGNPADANFSFCGINRQDGKPYCEYHASVAL
jgi:GcrA cell cycle regulator